MISDKKINKFEITIGYIFKNKKLLFNSLVHPSSLTDSKKNKIKVANDFERLEFLGDRVLGLAISSIIYAKFIENNRGGAHCLHRHRTRHDELLANNQNRQVWQEEN